MIYLVEDDNSIRELVIYTLQSTGFEAKGFACGADFWEGMKEEQPDLVLLDIMLPDEDGLSILRKLRGAAATQKLPVMMLTAKGTEYDKVIGLDQIAVFHINDSLNPLGAHKDRHANIGKGTIGFEPLYRLVHDPRFVEIPKILETPWLCAEGETKKTIPPYKEEIAQLLAK